MVNISASGSIRELSLQPYAVSVFFSAVFDGLMLAWMIDPERMQIDSIVPEIARIMWRGIGPEISDRSE